MTDDDATYGALGTRRSLAGRGLATDLRAAAHAGVLLGVKYGLAVLLTLFAVSWALRDYQTVRDGAAKGAQAFEYLQKVQQAQRATNAPAPQKEQ